MRFKAAIVMVILVLAVTMFINGLIVMVDEKGKPLLYDESDFSN